MDILGASSLIHFKVGVFRINLALQMFDLSVTDLRVSDQLFPWSSHAGKIPTFPVVIEVDVPEARAPVLLRALKDGVFLQPKLTQSVELQVGLHARKHKN